MRRSTTARGFFVLIGGAGTAQALTLAASPVLTRLYSPSELGAWATYTSLLLTLSTVAALRFDVAIVVADSDTEARGLLWLATRLNIVTALIATAAMSVAAPTIGSTLRVPELTPWLYALGLNVFILAQCQILFNWFTRSRIYSAISTQRITQAGTLNSTQIGAGIVGTGVSGLVVGTLVGGLSSLSIGLLYRRRDALTGGAATPGSPLARKYWKMPIFNGATALADSARVNGVQILVGALFSQYLLGLFALAWRSLLLPVTLISSALATLYYERFSRATDGTLLSESLRCLKICAALAAAPFILGAIVAPTVFGLVFGAEWQQAGDLARLMTPYIFMAFLASPMSSIFIVTGRQELSLVYSLSYLIAPAVVAMYFRENVFLFTQYFSLAMAAMLGLFIITALRTARAFDIDRWKAQAKP